MGDSQPPATATVDLVGSYARLRGPDVEIVLGEPTHEGLDGSMVMRLGRGRRRVHGSAELTRTASGTRLVGRVPRADLVDGTWRVVVDTADGAWRVDVRLLVQGRRPVVLLWGGTDRPGVEPEPRRPAPTGRQRAAATAGRVADRVLAPLPAGAATRVRQRARRAARRLLA